MGAAADHNPVAVGRVGEVLAVENRVARVQAHRLFRREGLFALGTADVRPAAAAAARRVMLLMHLVVVVVVVVVIIMQLLLLLLLQFLLLLHGV